MKNVLAALLWLITASSWAQLGIVKPATWRYTVKPATAKVGDVVELRFTATLKEGYHVYSSDKNPKLEDGPLPTVITLTPNATFQLVGNVQSLNVKPKFEEAFGGDVLLMSSPAVFIQKVKILQERPDLRGSLEAQACLDNGVCVPLNEDFTFTGLNVAASATSPTATTAAVTEAISTGVNTVSAVVQTAPDALTKAMSGSAVVAGKPEAATLRPDTSPVQTAAPVEEESLTTFIIAAFLSGIVALLTPCVFPIIPMTVSYFTHQPGGKWKAVLYGLFIIGIYVLVGTLVSRLNGPGFANFVSTHWLPNLLFFAIFFVFGLSFLGLFEITLPSGLVNQADQQAEKGGIGGIFFMAFTLVLVSFSCTGPLVGSLLVASAGGEVIKPIVGMAAFSSAFAIPFTLFAMFPQWLKGLPKSGGWLNSVKVVLGFLELALALKFLSIADQVYHWGLLDREVFLALWIVIFSLIGFYLLGKIRLSHDTELKSVTIPRLLLAIATFAFVVYMIPGLWGAPLRALSGYLPPDTTQEFNLTNVVNASPSNVADPTAEPPKYADLFKLPRGLRGYFDYDQALAYSRKVNKPVFIDFTGHGCVNCREMESRVWSDPAVFNRLQNDYIVVALYVDDKTELPETDWFKSTYDGKVKTTIGAQNADLQIVRYGANAQPHYCLVGPDGGLLVPARNYDLDAQRFAQFLDEGKAKFAQGGQANRGPAVASR